MRKSKRIKSITAIMSMVIVLSMLTAIPVLARVAQETITVNFNNIRIAVNGQHIQTEFEPFIFQGRTYLPVRDVADAMGFDVTWEDATNTVHLTSRNLSVTPNYPPHNPVTPVPPIGEIGNTQTATPTPSPQPTNPPATSSGQGNRPQNPAISLQRAIEIAEADLVRRGITANFHSNSGMDWERGQWVWELEFRVVDAPRGRHVIEYYINVDTGAIVKFEQGD
ncbi:MAG: stalk domain-containing protein [Defluviitaleaceae bacterium]|nr:stalk domain-containing protein [Defluviitaleaceae bacterium]